MARSGVYRTDVEKARKSLLERGKNPSIDAIRQVLGTGSKSTIHRHLKDLEADEALATGSKYPVSDVLAGLVQQLADRLHEEAEARIAHAQEQFETDRRGLLEQDTRRTQEMTDLAVRLQHTEADLGQETATHAATRDALIDARATLLQVEERVHGLVARVAEHEAHAQSLEQKHAQARDALEHFRTAAKDQRDQEQRRHEYQVQEIQATLRQVGDALNGKNQEVLQLSRDNVRLTEQLIQRDKDLHQCRSALRQAERAVEVLGTLEADHRHVQAQLAEERLRVEQLRNELATAQRDAKDHRRAHEEAEMKAVRSVARLEVFEAWAAKLPQRGEIDGGVVDQGEPQV